MLEQENRPGSQKVLAEDGAHPAVLRDPRREIAALGFALNLAWEFAQSPFYT